MITCCSSVNRVKTSTLRFRLFLMMSVLVLGMVGCAHKIPVPPSGISEVNCNQWIQRLDRTATTNDAQYSRVMKQPWLRTDRYLASFAEEPMADHVLHYWFQQLLENGKEGFTNEVLAIPNFGKGLDVDRLEECIDIVARQFFAAEFQPLWQAEDNDDSLRVAVKDHYSGLKRALGLYPIIKGAALKGILGYQQETKDSIASFDPALMGDLKTYRFPQSQKLSQVEVAELLKAAYDRSPLDTPRLDAVDLALLFERHAPELAVDQQHEDDQIGAISVSVDGEYSVQTNQPLVYTYPSYTRFRGENLLQLNYGFWFPSRPSDDVYGGFLDGIIWRVTLDKKGEVLLYDSIHQCGCYHKYFVPQDRQAELKEQVWDGRVEPPMVFYIQDPSPRARLYINSIEHYILKVTAGMPTATATQYQLAAYNDLTRLQTSSGYKSLFGDDGLVADSSRTERFYFWPLGIKSAGAMRQKGTHAIAFIGRQHFDDVDLLEQVFGSE